MTVKQWLYPLLIGGCALGLRFTNLHLFLNNDPTVDFLILDGWSYDRLALKILEESFWGHEPFFQDPLYPYFLAAIYWVFGHSLTPVKIIQCLLGTATALFIFGSTVNVLGRTQGLIAGLIAASYPTFIFYDCMLMKETLGLFFATAAFYALTGISAKTSIPRLLGAGMLFGLAVLTRGNLLLFVPFLLGTLLLQARWSQARAPWLSPLCVGCGILLIISPITIRNRVVGGEWILVTAQGGANLYIGNNPYSDGAAGRPPYLRASPEFEQIDFHYHAEQAVGRTLTKKEANAYWKAEAMKFICENPGTAVRLLWRKTKLFFNYYEIPDNYNQVFYHQYSWVLRNPLGVGVVLVLGLTGMLFLYRRWRELLIFYLFIPLYAGSVIAFHVYDRYRLTVIPVIIVFAAGLIHLIALNLRRREWLVPLAAVLVIDLVMLGVFRTEQEYSLARSYFMRGLGLSQQGRNEEAIRDYQQTLALDPRFARAHNNLGKLQFLAQDYQNAERSWLKALHYEPTLAEVHNNLGRLYVNQGQFPKAITSFTNATEQRRDYFKAQYNLAQVYSMVGETDKALEWFEQAFRSDPQSFLQAIAPLSAETEQAFRAQLHLRLLETSRQLNLPPAITESLTGLTGE